MREPNNDNPRPDRDTVAQAEEMARVRDVPQNVDSDVDLSTIGDRQPISQMAGSPTTRRELREDIERVEKKLDAIIDELDIEVDGE